MTIQASVIRHRQRVIKWLSGVFAAAIVTVMVLPAVGAPNISGLYPPAVQRGREVRVTIGGNQLTDPQDIVFYEPGVELIALEAYGDNRLTAVLKVADDCAPGQIPLRVCTARGVSNLKQLGITALPCVDEAEPKDGEDPLAAVVVPKVATICGVLESEDEDVFAIELAVGEVLSYEIEALRHGRVEMDAEIWIVDPSGKVVHRCDDTSLTLHDPYGRFVAEAAGKHTIHVREARRRGNGGYQYLLHLGKFPRPAMGLPGGGRPGEEVNVTWIQEGREPWQQTIRIPDDAKEVHRVHAIDAGGIAPTANEFHVQSGLQTVAEIEPNDAYAAGQNIEVPCAVAGVLHKDSDTDSFQFSAKKGQRFQLSVYGRRHLRSPIDAVLRIRKLKGGQIASADDSQGPDCLIDFNAPEDGEYVVNVSDQLKRGGPLFAYRLEITPIERSLTLRSPERSFRLDPTLNLPRGNRMALLVNVVRQNFGEQVTLDWGQLPRGVTVDAPVIPQGQDRVSVVFHVAPDATRGGHLLPVTGRAQVGDTTIEGGYHQRTPLIRGQNNRDVWGVDADRIAASITDEPPFEVEVIQPPVPLVRNGTLPLVVKVKRRDGWKQPIKLNVLHTPPGVAARRDVMVAADADTAEVALTANGNALLASVPIVVIAEASKEGVAYICSSRLIDLRVEESIFSVAFDKASVEQGKQTEMLVKVTRNREYQGELVAELVGLPSGTQSEIRKVAPDAEQIAFPISATEEARTGRFNTVICQLRVLPKPDASPSESILHVLGTGQLRVDKPLPTEPQKNKAAPQDKANPSSNTKTAKN